MSEAARARVSKSRTDSQAALSLTTKPATVEPLGSRPGAARAIEDEGFPFEALSHVAELESWRKEVNRPLSHIHKWWAQRLGTVFRAIVLGTFAPAGSNILDLFYTRARIPDATVFDPFMGSGTTVIEALKLGARAVGRDINPVAFFQVRNALAKHDRATVLATFAAIERDVGPKLRRFYQTDLGKGRVAEVLYYFWVKTLPCPSCATPVDLFSSYIFAKNAYPDRVPEAQAVCPHCGEVNLTRHDAHQVTCCGCRKDFDPQHGPARGQQARCPCCEHEFSIAKTVRTRATAPAHRLYAKLVLLPDRKKTYLRATEADEALYAQAEKDLAARPNAYPVVAISPGENTNQALGYNYRHWHEMFNARQLLSLSILGERIGQINDPAMRDLFMCLMSGTLEFNNMFASYKGEGTGAVRHMFYHHILKPERVPLEANLWGTTKSSGSFSTLFESRVMRALTYAENPFELRVGQKNGKASGEKIFDLSPTIGHTIAASYPTFADGERVYLSCGDSSRTDLADGSIDAVISDPPFFDNVHYSELADFFHVWQRHVLGRAGALEAVTTRAAGEVQNADEDTFTARLTAVWSECHRVLKDDGLLVFTYHHSRAEGWSSVLKATMDSGFAIVAAHPIKAEMSGATPKHLAKEPIDLDIILVCRKNRAIGKDARDKKNLWSDVTKVSEHQVQRLRDSGRKLSRNDIRVIVMAQHIRYLSSGGDVAKAIARLKTEELVTHRHKRKKTLMPPSPLVPGEELTFTERQTPAAAVPDADINEKYVRGEIRIVTEQARYPLNTIKALVENPSYKLSPEYQRRHRWSVEQKSRLIESLIINVPIPPVFLYEHEYSKYEVMDGLQRLTAIHEFYSNSFALAGMTQWAELEGKTYETLPDKIREGIDRRFLSSVILLKETAKSDEDALRLKQLVFERLNSGGTKLTGQESRNAIFDGPLNTLCLKLSKNAALCRLWDLPEPDQQELSGGPASDARVAHDEFRTMGDVELVLRFFAYRQKHRLHKSAIPLSRYLDDYLRHGNSTFTPQTLTNLEALFVDTISLVEDVLGEKAFWLYRRRGKTERWSWLERPATTVYDPLMLVFSHHLDDAVSMRAHSVAFQERIPQFYNDNYSTFEGRNVNPSILTERESRVEAFVVSILSLP